MKSRTVGEIMTSDVVCASRETSSEDVLRLLNRHRIRALPVVDHDDKVIGVVSGSDLAQGRMARARTGRDRWFRLPGRGRSAHGSAAGAAGELMTSPAVTVHPEQRVSDAARVMERHQVDRLPVVDEEDRIIGIATRRDLLRAFLLTDEEIRRQLSEEVLPGVLGLPPGAVTVSVRDGMVVLDGCLLQSSDIPSVIRSIWRVDGVVGVMNRLRFADHNCRPPAEELRGEAP
ncbi:CBS domain-containing protein [Streptomyces sp. NK08204]|uniref:CBS domain-containing protein n=1 Tax=Streptomyces sp. NK08204 TaxID=2873260 RepID=UPI001CEC4B77|nr:CBS domain-containing protein [Streptomyces sp. NK08204]